MIDVEHIEKVIFPSWMVNNMTDAEVRLVRDVASWCKAHAGYIIEEDTPRKDLDIKDAFMKVLPEVSGMFWDTIFQRSRKWQFLRWRQMVFAIWYSRTTDTQEAIGNMVGQDHATVANGIARCYQHRESDYQYNIDYKKLKKAVYAAINNQITNN